MGWREKNRPVRVEAWWYQGMWIGGKCPRYCNWYRYPRTTQEMRRWDPDPDLGRPKRNPTRLPEAWDDVHRTCQRSWKEHRKTRWRKCVEVL